MQRASAVLQTPVYARKRAQRSVEKGGNRSVPLSLRAQGIAGEKGHGCRALARFGKTLACQSTGKQERGVVEQHVQEREGEKERERERKRERERERGGPGRFRTFTRRHLFSFWGGTWFHEFTGRQ